MEQLSQPHDDGCLICGRGEERVPVGVLTIYTGEGERHGARVWICEECAQIEDFARAFVTQAREHFTSFGDGAWQGSAYSYRIVSPVLRAQVDEHGFNRFHAWTADI